MGTESLLGAAHRWVGVGTVAVFLATGVIMRRHHLELLGAESGLRLLFRSRHVYLLFSGLLNLSVGVQYAMRRSVRGRRAMAVGSALILASPLLLAGGFFVEAASTGRAGPLSAAGVFAAFLGISIQAVSRWRPPDRGAESRRDA